MAQASGEFTAAGILITDGAHVLAGFQPNKNSISGFGGSRIGRETIRETAFREAIEELLEPEPEQNIRPFIQSLQRVYKNRRFNRKGTYRFLQLHFIELLQILEAAKAAGIKSQLYKTIPTTLKSLIKKRQPTATSEVATLMLLPLNTTEKSIDPHFLDDIHHISA